MTKEDSMISRNVKKKDSIVSTNRESNNEKKFTENLKEPYNKENHYSSPLRTTKSLVDDDNLIVVVIWINIDHIL